MYANKQFKENFYNKDLKTSQKKKKHYVWCIIYNLSSNVCFSVLSESCETTCNILSTKATRRQMCSNMKPSVYRKYMSTYWAMHRFKNKNNKNVSRLSCVYFVNFAQFVSIAQSRHWNCICPVKTRQYMTDRPEFTHVEFGMFWSCILFSWRHTKLPNI